MADKRHTTIDLADWLHQLDGLSLLAAGADRADEANLIRLFQNLLERAPNRSLIEGLQLPDTLHIEALLSFGANDSAALAFLGAEIGYCISRSGQGAHLFSVILPRCCDETTASGTTLPLACLGALAQALANVAPVQRPQTTVTPLRSNLLH